MDDGWQDGRSDAVMSAAGDEFSRPGPATALLPDRTVRLITRNRSPDIGFDRSINAFKGCEHGCV